MQNVRSWSGRQPTPSTPISSSVKSAAFAATTKSFGSLRFRARFWRGLGRDRLAANSQGPNACRPKVCSGFGTTTCIKQEPKACRVIPFSRDMRLPRIDKLYAGRFEIPRVACDNDHIVDEGRGGDP